MTVMVAGGVLLLLLLVGGFASQRTMLVLFLPYSGCYSCAVLGLFLGYSWVVLALFLRFSCVIRALFLRYSAAILALFRRCSGFIPLAIPTTPPPPLPFGGESTHTAPPASRARWTDVGCFIGQEHAAPVLRHQRFLPSPARPVIP